MLNSLCRLAFPYFCVTFDQNAGTSSHLMHIFQTEQPLMRVEAVLNRSTYLRVLIAGAAMPKMCSAPGRN